LQKFRKILRRLGHGVGAALHETDGGYVGRVLTEQGYLRRVADGQGVPLNAPSVAPIPTAEATDAGAERVALLR